MPIQRDKPSHLGEKTEGYANSTRQALPSGCDKEDDNRYHKSIRFSPWYTRGYIKVLVRGGQQGCGPANPGNGQQHFQVDGKSLSFSSIFPAGQSP
ncbi:hypothetical protein TNCV_3651071 [Trichonephila clavipes]|nr:hypothetical protein TNCV_3651071 [Trichonephila clavipes]